MKRRGAAEVLAQTAGITPEQELQFWKEQAELLRQRQQEELPTEKPSKVTPQE